MAQGQRIAFVTCVEAGPLESMVVRLCASVRTFGGEVGGAGIYAVSPRFTAKLSRSTRAAFEELGVTYISKRYRHSFGWYNFLNKPLSVLAALEAGDEDIVVWLDADTLVVQEPSDLRLDRGEAAGVCAPCHDIIGSTGSQDPRDRWWQELCEVADVPLDSLPVITTHGTNRRIRMYLQAGVFGVRRDTGFAEAYLQMCEKLLSARVALSGGAHWLEQIALGFALVRGKFVWREWPWAVNYAVASFLQDRYSRPEFGRVQILHYHDAMAAAHFPVFAERLDALGRQQGEWLRAMGPVSDPQNSLSRMVAFPATFARRVQGKLHVMRSRQL